MSTPTKWACVLTCPFIIENNCERSSGPAELPGEWPSGPAEWPGGPAERPGGQVAEIVSSSDPEWTNDPVAEWPNDSVAEWPDGQVAKWSDDPVAKWSGGPGADLGRLILATI